MTGRCPSWLFQATRLTANNFVRSESRRHQREEEAYMQSVLDEAGTGIWPGIAPLLDTAVAGLREKDRQAIVLRFYEGRNLREVGLALGASEVAAEKRVNRALEKLREYFRANAACIRLRKPLPERFPPIPFKPRRWRWPKP